MTNTTTLEKICTDLPEVLPEGFFHTTHLYFGKNYRCQKDRGIECRKLFDSGINWVHAIFWYMNIPEIKEAMKPEGITFDTDDRFTEGVELHAFAHSDFGVTVSGFYTDYWLTESSYYDPDDEVWVNEEYYESKMVFTHVQIQDPTILNNVLGSLFHWEGEN